ncbi:MAG: methyltransferase domain-containing protein [Thaumarchaeota archaeon]|nr:methyltransferase domain-containing protein [Nitrososphaerota archaeon]
MHKQALYAQLAEYYDKIYWWKDYNQEVEFLMEAFRKYGVHGKRILEVACGTGNHTKLLTKRGYEVTGVDLSADVLRIARRKVRRGATFLQGDMRNLSEVVQGEYDAVVCLFSAISYNTNLAELRRTLEGFHAHLKRGGLAILDTHFTKEGFRDGYRGEDIFDDGDVIGARLSTSKRFGDIGELTFSYLIKDGQKTIVLRNDRHRLGLFAPEDILRVMKEAGFAKLQVFKDWTLTKGGKKPIQSENVFVGQKA